MRGGGEEHDRHGENSGQSSTPNVSAGKRNPACSHRAPPLPRHHPQKSPAPSPSTLVKRGVRTDTGSPNCGGEQQKGKGLACSMTYDGAPLLTSSTAATPPTGAYLVPARAVQFGSV